MVSLWFQAPYASRGKSKEKRDRPRFSSYPSVPGREKRGQELARRLGRDVKRVHEDAATLVELGLIERTASGGLVCPYSDIHVDMHLRRAA